MMKDTVLRGIVLNEFYSQRRKGSQLWSPAECPSNVESEEFFRIAEQLGENGLIDWEPRLHLGRGPYSLGGMGRINASGVDVIEGTQSSPISITIDNSVRVSDSPSAIIQAGNGNSQTVTQDFSTNIEQLFSAVEEADCSASEKEEAKSLLARFLEHPLVNSLVGGVASGLAGK